MFEQYDKIHDFVALSKPFLETNLPEGSLILNWCLTFAVKLTSLQDYYKLKFRLCANESSMVEGIDFDLSLCHMTDTYIILLIFNIAAMLGFCLYYYDIFNAFNLQLKHPRKDTTLTYPTFIWNGIMYAGQYIKSTPNRPKNIVFNVSIICKEKK